MQEYSFDVDAASFDRDVIAASREAPVVVDFWAPWCAPCRVLKPILERLALEYEGKFRLAKLNTDEHPELAGRYGVRGIPNVKAFVDGEFAGEFTGALPESQVRQFLEKLVPSPARWLQRAARDDVQAGELEVAEAKLREALALDAELHAARIDLVEVLLARGDAARAATELHEIPEHDRDERAAKLAARIDFAAAAQTLPAAATLREAVAQAPADLEGRLRLAQRLVADGDLAGALESYLEVVRRDRRELRDRARRGMVDVFTLVDDAELVADFRRRLSAELN